MFNTSKILKTGTIVAIATIIIGYTYFQTKNMAKGPTIEIDFPVDGMTLDKSLVKVKGSVKNVSYITLNDRQIFADEEGNFSEMILLSEGYNVIEVEVRDRFERVESEKLELVYDSKSL